MVRCETLISFCLKGLCYIVLLLWFMAASDIYLATLHPSIRIFIFIVLCIGIYQDECGIRTNVK
jgi:hypothetical protein